MKQQHSRHEVSQLPAYLLSYLCSISHSAIDSLLDVGQVVQVRRSLPSHRNTEAWVTARARETATPAWGTGSPSDSVQRSCSLLRGTMKEQNPAPVVVGLQEEGPASPRQRPAAPDAQGLGPALQELCRGLAGDSSRLARGHSGVRCPVPSPRPGALVPCHLLARRPGCSPMSCPIPTALAAAPSSPAVCWPFPASHSCAAAVAEHSNRVLFQVIFEELHDYLGAYVAEIMEWINESLVGLSFKLKKKKKKSYLCHKCMI